MLFSLLNRESLHLDRREISKEICIRPDPRPRDHTYVKELTFPFHSLDKLEAQNTKILATDATFQLHANPRLGARCDYS